MGHQARDVAFAIEHRFSLYLGRMCGQYRAHQRTVQPRANVVSRNMLLRQRIERVSQAAHLRR